MWYSKVTNNLAEIPNFITHFEHELEIAKSECRVGGLVEKNIKALPGLTEHRFNQLQEIEKEIKKLVEKKKMEHFEKII